MTAELPAARTDAASEVAETDIAIVGMAGRFPGAPDVDTLWRRVAAGDDCLTDFDDAHLAAEGVPAERLADPDYVKRNGVLADVEMFDAAFFGVGPRDAAIMDPQHRHFLECAWEALESSGHVPERFAGSIGVFAGCGMNTYLLNNLLTNPELVEQVGMFLLRHTANDKDFLTTTLSYKLDLRGPSVNVQTACSTSLVAVHLAAQSLIGFECDLALAGGVTIEVPHRVGYQYQEGEILAPDGYCRAFDEKSAGTVLTSGVGVVALRRLADALEDQDPILAVIKGSAINNDGQRKVGYLAPSVDGHADVVKEALAVAGLSARDIQLLEAHGTGTAVGDPIEVAALTEAFRASTTDTGFCRLVSTKPNIGHLDTAAGVASLIKVVQALRHQTLPPIANHTAPSPLLDIERTPFVLSGEAAPWPGDRPRRAGISSLGVGGTNAHVIVEEAPPPSPPSPAPKEQILVLSGLDNAALDRTAARLADHLEAEADLPLADVAYTLATGRRVMAHRRVLVAADTTQAVDLLRTGDRNRVATHTAGDSPPKVAFMFPGGGSQYTGMAAGLDERFEVFHATMRDGIERVRRLSGVDLAALLAPDGDPDKLRETTASLPAVFLTSVALARQWMAWGVTPNALVGHSLGEYVAAHLAGVLTLDGALELVVARSRLMGEATGAGGAMLAVPLPEADVARLLPPTVSLATINADDECVVAGPAPDVMAMKERLADEDVTATLIPLAAAAHSSLLDPVLPDFLAVVKGVDLSAPQIPYVSNLTGTWITTEQATDPQYWVDHLRNTVRFADGLATVLADGPTVLLELGPGHSLSSYARRQSTKPVAAIPALRHPNQEVDDTAATLLAFARTWAAGVDVDVAQIAGPNRRRLRLPGYAFEKRRYWIEPGAGRAVTVPAARTEMPPAPAPGPTVNRVPDLDHAFWAPEWEPRDRVAPARPPIGPWVVVGDDGDQLAAALTAELVAKGFEARLVSDAEPVSFAGARSVVLVGPTDGFDRAVDRWLHTAATAAIALGETSGEPTLLGAVTRGATDAGGQAATPCDALALGIIRTAPREYTELRTALIDLDSSTDTSVNSGADALAVLEELLEGSEQVVALRGGRRLIPSTSAVTVERPPADAVPFRRGGTYLVTGALGGVGFALARHLATEHEANLVIVSSHPVPDGAERDEWLARHGYDDATSRRIRRLRELEACGRTVTVVDADLADPAAVRAAVDQAIARVGKIDGAIHAAGQLRDRPIELATAADHEVVIGAKARGAVTLADELARRGVELLVLISSTSTVLAPDGQTSYVAANSVLDALAGTRDGLRIVTINYGLWAEMGIAAETARRTRLEIEPGTPVAHPVLSEVHVDRVGTVRVVGTLDASHHWVVDEHRTATGTALLPGTGHIELLLAAAEFAGVPQPALQAVTLLEPLVVADGSPVTVRVTISSSADGRWAQVESDGGVGVWRLHSEAQIAEQPVDSRPVVDTSRPSVASEVAPLGRPTAHLTLGPRWMSVADAWRADDITGGRVELPEPFRGEQDAWLAHPALVDVATAFGVALGERDDALYVPVGYDQVVRHGPMTASPRVTAVRLPDSTVDVLRVDLTLADDDGAAALIIHGLTLRPIDDPAALAVPVSAPPAGEDGGAHHHHVAPLVALAETHGIRATEGPELLARLLGSGRSRLIASSIDLDDLLRLLVPTPPSPATGEPAAPARGGATITDAIRAMWVELLGVDDVGDHDDFFEIGGHSLIAIRLMTRIHKQLGVRFQLATIFDAPTIASLASLVREARPELEAELASASAPDTASGDASPAVAAPAPATATAPVKLPHQALVTISAAGDKAPLFIVHGAGGNVLFLWSLARAIGNERPIYGFQAYGVDGADMPDPTIEAMAARYIRELRANHDGPYLLGGYSGGGIVTFEMARQLQELGEEVRVIVLFDSVPPGKAFPTRPAKLRNLASNIRRHGFEPLRPYVTAHVKHMVRQVIPGQREREAWHAAEQHDLGLNNVEDLGFVNLWFYFSATAERYQLRPLDVNAILLKAQWVWPIQPHDYYWSPYIRGRLDIAEVPGDHNAMFLPENAPHMAEVLRSLLEPYEP